MDARLPALCSDVWLLADGLPPDRIEWLADLLGSAGVARCVEYVLEQSAVNPLLETVQQHRAFFGYVD